MKTSRPSTYPSTFLIVSIAVWIAVSLRWIIVFIEHSHPYLWLLSTMLAAYGILLVLYPTITKSLPIKAHLYFGIQSTIIIGAMLLFYGLDFFALLFAPLA